MISRSLLSNTISKYHLNGLVEKVIWKVKDNLLHIAFRNEVGNVTGEIKVPCKMVEGDFNIYDTSRLNKLLNILEGTILIDVINNTSNIPTVFKIADSKMDVHYNLASPGLLVGFWFDSSVVEKQILQYDVTADLNEEDLRLFLKSVGALGNEVLDFQTSTREELNGEEIVFSLGTDFTNRVSFGVSCNIVNPVVEALTFEIEAFKEVFQSNKSLKSGKLHFSNKGIIKLEFTEETGEDEEIEVVYYIAKKQ
jgi:hypothetical protein